MKSFILISRITLSGESKNIMRGKSAATKSRAPFKLIYYESYLSKQDAKRREEHLKLHGRAFAQLKKRLEDTLHLA